MRRDADPASPHGPIANPTDRYAHLPEPTRKWLDEQRPEDLDDWRRAMRTYRAARIFFNVTWKIIVTLVAAFMGTLAFGKGILEALSTFGTK